MSYVWRVDVECLQAGHHMGTVEVVDERQALPLKWQLARCALCGGQAMRGGAVRKFQISMDVQHEPIRRGRPPKWMLDPT